MNPLFLKPDFEPASQEDVKFMKEQIRSLDMSLSKLSSDLEANVVRIRSDQAVSNMRMKEMIDQLRKEVLDRHRVKELIDGNEVTNEEATTFSSAKTCNNSHE